MGTSCDIARLNPDGTIRVIHVSGDGYPSGVGVTLFRFYDTPEALTALFGGTTHAEGIAFTLPEHLEWFEDGWHPDVFTRDEFIAEFTRHDDDEPIDIETADIDDVTFAGTYFYAHGKWIYPRNGSDILTFIDTGQSPYVMTRDFLNRFADMKGWPGHDPWTVVPEPPISNLELGERYAATVEDKPGVTVNREEGWIQIIDASHPGVKTTTTYSHGAIAVSSEMGG